MTLSFHKVMFSAEEVLDMISEIEIERASETIALADFGAVFLQRAEARSRAGTRVIIEDAQGDLWRENEVGTLDCVTLDFLKGYKAERIKALYGPITVYVSKGA